MKQSLWSGLDRELQNSMNSLEETVSPGFSVWSAECSVSAVSRQGFGGSLREKSPLRDRELDLQAKFRLTAAVSAAGLVALSASWLHDGYSRLLAEKQAQARDLVAVPYSIADQQHRLEEEGKISRAEGQSRVIEFVKQARYDNGNYYWIVDMRPAVVMQPANPELTGKDVSDLKDAQGKAFLAEAEATVKKQGEGFVRYKWFKPGQESKAAVSKLSFVKGFEPWGWIIGTGIYTDDLDAAWRADAATAAVITTACLLVLLLVSVGVARSIFPRLNLVVGQMKSIGRSGGDFTRTAEIHLQRNGQDSNDEITVLVAGFNEMLAAIKKRDEELQRHSEELEREVTVRTAELQRLNSDLTTAHADIELFLECIPSILIGLDPDGHVTIWNQTASKVLGISDDQAKGRPFAQCGIRWIHPDMDKRISEWLRTDSILRCEDAPFDREGRVRFVGFSLRPIIAKDKQKMGFIITGADVTDKRSLEEQLRQAHRLEAVGQLAAGIAHEINTPTQYVADNTTFLKEASQPLMQLVGLSRRMRREADSGSVSRELLAAFDELVERSDFPYLEREMPAAVDQSLEGLHRIAKIVAAMKEFSHPGSGEKVPTDINRAIETTITVARNEWKYVADLEARFDSALPLVPCLRGEFNQVILNLIVNAAQAISSVVGDGSKGKGKITITTEHDEQFAQVAICDTGSGIPSEIQSRIFEPFFTTKPVGKGTGQGLALAHSTIVKRHAGRIWFETAVGRGTTFFVRLPLKLSLTATSNV